MTHLRYAIYAVPSGDLGARGAQWLGWDIRNGSPVPEVANRDPAWVKRPQKYGFHATLCAPFRLSETANLTELSAHFSRFCATRTAPFALPLQIQRIGSFFALCFKDPAKDVTDLASAAVTEFHPFRAPLNAQEFERRAPHRLNEQQRVYLEKWGYPHVFEHFKFHITLTGPIKADQQDDVTARLTTHFGHTLGTDYSPSQICLVGERADGRFECLECADLST